MEPHRFSMATGPGSGAAGQVSGVSALSKLGDPLETTWWISMC